jgi:5-methylcytosine-specific restriction enzyme A
VSPRRPCLVCGRPTNGSRCPEHTIERPDWRRRGYDAEYDRNRRALLAVSTRCAVCGLPSMLNDPLTADHIVPRSEGGGNEQSNLRAVHRSCNQRRGKGGGYRRS